MNIYKGHRTGCLYVDGPKTDRDFALGPNGDGKRLVLYRGPHATNLHIVGTPLYTVRELLSPVDYRDLTDDLQARLVEWRLAGRL